MNRLLVSEAGVAIVRGLRVLTCGHSFHRWIAEIVCDMAGLAGLSEHRMVGAHFIGGSRVSQHWEVPEEANEAKKALCTGAVDVLTLSPIWLPDEGIGDFAALAVKHKPDVRVTVQAFWLPNDVYEPVYPLQTWKQVDHNAAVIPELRMHHARYFQDIEAAVRDVNGRLGREAVFVVPVGQAALALREAIVAGTAPGLESQADLFSDSWGHPTPPLWALNAYCHFAVIYRRSPIGLPLPKVLAEDPRWSAAVPLNRLLQELAWDAVMTHCAPVSVGAG